MKYGVCTGLENAHVFESAGYDFIELNVQVHLMPEKSDDDFADVLESIKKSPLPCLCANGFIPAHLKITGPNVQPDALSKYVDTACRRASEAGIEKIVFGSGGARAVPENFDRSLAWKQLVEFGHMVSDAAEKHGVTIVVEPLNKAECNILTSVGESARYVREVNRPKFRLLVDAYHWLKDSDSFDDLADAGALLYHVHIATKSGRVAPGLEDCDFSDFFAALKKGGYDGTLSFEGGWGQNEISEVASFVLKTMKSEYSKA